MSVPGHGPTDYEGDPFEMRALWRLTVWGIVASGAVGLCELALRTRFRSNPLLARAFIDACSIAYWSKLRRAAGPALVREFLRP